jgi:hypothetical protein
MPSAWHEVSLVPLNFFARNPALDPPAAWRAGGKEGWRSGVRPVIIRGALAHVIPFPASL